MIQEHIHSLLFEHDCVIIPDFGGLITHYEPARIHPVKHSFLPPAKRIAFNEQLKLNDGLLISTFAYDKHISQEEAQRQVSAFVQNLNYELQASHRFELKGIGVFRLNAERKIEFDYIPNENFLNDSFGLPELIARPVLANDAATGLRTLLKEKQNERAISTAKPTLRKKVRRIYDIASVFAISGLTLSALYFISLQTDYSLSSLNPFALYNSEAPAKEKPEPVAAPEGEFSNFQEEDLVEDPETTPENIPAEEIIPATPKTKNSEMEALPEVSSKPENNKPEIVKPTINKEVTVRESKENIKVAAAKPVIKSTENNALATIKNQTGRYYIVAGGYTNTKNADWTRNILEKQHGKESKIIEPYPGSKLHRVTISDFASKEEALQQLPGLKKKFGKNIWILNY